MISNINKKILLNEEVTKLEKQIAEAAIPVLIDLGIDILEFNGSPDQFPFLIEEIENHSLGYHLLHTGRFNRAFQIWSSKTINQDHYMGTTCTAKERSMNVPISEEYEINSFKEILDEHGLYSQINEHCELITVDNMYSITYSETPDQQMFAKLRDLHPYCVAHTLHELLKLMMEWEWCYLNLDSTEPVAEISHLALVNMGISIQKIEKSEVVKAIWALPDMQVAKFLKNEPYSPELIDPLEPLDFKLWISQNSLFRFTKRGLGNLYVSLIKWKLLKKKINEL